MKVFVHVRHHIKIDEQIYLDRSSRKFIHRNFRRVDLVIIQQTTLGIKFVYSTRLFKYFFFNKLNYMDTE